MTAEHPSSFHLEPMRKPRFPCLYTRTRSVFLSLLNNIYLGGVHDRFMQVLDRKTLILTFRICWSSPGDIHVVSMKGIKQQLTIYLDQWLLSLDKTKIKCGRLHFWQASCWKTCRRSVLVWDKRGWFIFVIKTSLISEQNRGLANLFFPSFS